MVNLKSATSEPIREIADLSVSDMRLTMSELGLMRRGDQFQCPFCHQEPKRGAAARFLGWLNGEATETLNANIANVISCSRCKWLNDLVGLVMNVRRVSMEDACKWLSDQDRKRPRDYILVGLRFFASHAAYYVYIASWWEGMWWAGKAFQDTFDDMMDPILMGGDLEDARSAWVSMIDSLPLPFGLRNAPDDFKLKDLVEPPDSLLSYINAIQMFKPVLLNRDDRWDLVEEPSDGDDVTWWLFKNRLIRAIGCFPSRESTERAVIRGVDRHIALADTPENRSSREPIPESVRAEVWRRDLGKCNVCGSNESLEFDHIIPVSKGGANTTRNIQLLCEPCNRRKSDRI